MTAWTVHSDVFDGPLDLLLYLVRRDGVDLASFPIHPVADAYLAYLDRMRDLHLAVAGEYLVMAATLCWLKSLELLPRRPEVVDDDDGEDPREALARQLCEYARYRDAADALDTRVQVGREVFVRTPAELDDDRRPVATGLDAFALLDLYHDLLTRDAAPDPELEIAAAGPDLATVARSVLAWLGGPGGRGELTALLTALSTRAERVAAFIAVLELARLRWVDLVQRKHLGPVDLVARVGPEVDLEAAVG